MGRGAFDTRGYCLVIAQLGPFLYDVLDKNRLQSFRVIDLFVKVIDIF